MTTQHSILIGLIIFLGLLTKSYAQDEQRLFEKSDSIRKVIATFRQDYDVPAISVGLFIEGESIFINLGHYDRSQKKVIDENAVFQIASVSKIFLGTLINSLIQEGKIDRNAPVSNYLPEDYPDKILNRLKAVTIRDLLHHRSGLPGDSKILRKKRKGNHAFIYDYRESDFIKDLSKMRLKNQPGKVYSYSNFGYALLGYVAERVSGLSYEELLKKYIRARYELTSSSTLLFDQSKLVTAYRKDKRQLVIAPWQMGKLVPPSGLFSTTADLLRLAKMQLNAYNEGDNGVLVLTNDVRLAHKGSIVDYGYGFRKYEDSYWHGGEMDGYAGFYGLNTKKRVAFVVLSSCNGDEINILAKKISGILYH